MFVGQKAQMYLLVFILQVVHLIRDPRGIASSRLTLHPKLNLADAMKFTCSRQAANLDISFHEKPEWLQYKVLQLLLYITILCLYNHV